MKADFKRYLGRTKGAPRATAAKETAAELNTT